MNDARQAWVSRGGDAKGRWVERADGLVWTCLADGALSATSVRPSGTLRQYAAPTAGRFEAAWRSAGASMRLADAEERYAAEVAGRR